MNEMAEAPDWLDENKVDEVLFCQEFLMEHPMVCVRGTFFTIERRITNERELKKLIYEKLKVYVKMTFLCRRIVFTWQTGRCFWPAGSPEKNPSAETVFLLTTIQMRLSPNAGCVF